MKKTQMRGLIWVCVLAFGTLLISSAAWADFYVVAGGKKARRTVLVKPGATAAASGTALLNALDGITDASASNPYLIIIEPGVYDIGSNTLRMQSHVDIQGAGENFTKITGNKVSLSGVVEGANDSELRFLTVENSGGGTYAMAISNSSVSPAITHVTAIASGGDYNYGIFNDYASPTMTYVTAKASGGTYSYGISNDSSSPHMYHVTATASGAGYNFGVRNETGSSGSMDNMIIKASGGGGFSYGVWNNTSSPTMTNVTVSASGGTYNRAIQNIGPCFFTISHVTAAASGGAISCGITNDTSAFPTVIHSTVTASGAGINCGIENNSNSSIKIDHSVISGTSTVVINSGCTGFIGNTQLEGMAVICDGTCTCAGVYDEDHAFYASTCP